MHRLQPLTATLRRPSASRDAARFADGVAASMRQFSASIITHEDSPPKTPPPTRRADSQKLSQDILKTTRERPPPSAARASTPAQQPRIHRIQSTGTVTARGGPPQRGPLLRRNPQIQNAARGSAARGVGPFRGGFPRGGARGGGMQSNRGGSRGRDSRGRGDREFRPRRDAGNAEDETKIVSKEQKIDFYLNELPAEQLLIEYKDQFRTPEELETYTEIMTRIEDIGKFRELAEKVRAEAKVQNDNKAKKDLEEAYEGMDKMIGESFRQLQAVTDSIEVSHEPAELDVDEFYHDRIGRAPIGKQGFGVIVQDAVRYIANRQEMKYENPKKLAQKLINGEMVKFTNVWEKMVVMKTANGMEGQSGKKKGEWTQYAPLAPAARGDLVKSIIDGRYPDHNDMKVEGATLKNAARILGNNDGYQPEQKSAVLQALQSLLPAGPAQPSQKRAG